MNQNDTIDTIARQILRLETLETRKSDSLDFHDIAVWQIKEALEAAYAAGQASVTGPTVTAPAPRRMRIVAEVLDMAKDAGDQIIIDACRRLMTANSLGWKKYASRRDWSLVSRFHDALGQ